MLLKESRDIGAVEKQIPQTMRPRIRNPSMDFQRKNLDYSRTSSMEKPRTSVPETDMKSLGLFTSRSVAVFRPEYKNAVNKFDGYRASSALQVREGSKTTNNATPVRDMKEAKSKSTLFKIIPSPNKKLQVAKPAFNLNSHVKNAHYRAQHINEPVIFAGSGFTHSIPMTHRPEYKN